MITDIRSNRNLSAVSRVLTLAQAPDYVRQATLDDAGANVEKHASFFADPNDCCLPIHTKVACYLSRAYFEVQRDSLPRSKRSAIESRLSQMEEQHKIAADTQRIKEVVQAERDNAPEAIDHRLGSKLASGELKPKADALVVLARNLMASCPKLADSPRSFSAKWAFTRQFRSLDANVRAMWVKYPQHKEALFALADEIGQLSPRQQVIEMPAIASKLAQFEPDLIKLQQRLALMPLADAPQIKLASCIFPETQVKESLCGLHKIASVPLINAPLATPVCDWQDRIEGLPGEQQRRLADFLLDSRRS